jgi:hypothetical protein
MKSPWTHEELGAMKRRLAERCNQTEERRPNIRPVPPMTEAEAAELLQALAETALARVLTEDEVFLHGQLLAAYRMAVRASMLGRKGRYYVLSEEDIARAAAIEGKDNADRP